MSTCIFDMIALVRCHPRYRCDRLSGNRTGLFPQPRSEPDGRLPASPRPSEWEKLPVRTWERKIGG